MDKYDEKILYLLHGLYEFDEEGEKEILKVLEKMTEEEKIDIAYLLYKKYNIESEVLKQAMSKLKIIDHSIDEYNFKKEVDLWLDKILSQIEDKKN